MKTLLFALSVVLLSTRIAAQVVCAGLSPASVAGNYSFSWGSPADGWGSPDFSVPGNYVTGELMLVDDGSTGNSPASGLPLANYGCADLTNDLTGKIALVYRYDGVTASTICWMSEKALFAQNAGAIAVVIVNRPGANEDLGTGGGSAAPGVSIPVVLISYVDGGALRAEMQNGPVNMFIGNKTGLFADDLGMNQQNRLISRSYGVSSQLSQNGGEFSFDLGTRVYNHGINEQNNVMVSATIDGPGGTPVYNQSAGPVTILSGDSADILSLPPFSLSSYPPGTYTLTYSVTNGGTDGYPGDNEISSAFVINDSLIGYSRLDADSQLPLAQNFLRPSTNNASYSICTSIRDANASRIGIEGLYFSAATGYGSGVSLNGEEITLNIYRWDDPFTDLNDAALAFDNLSLISFGYYYYTSDLQNQVVYAPLPNPVVLEDDKRYLACVQTTNTSVYFGVDLKTNYVWNESYYLQPMFPVENDGGFFASGFGAETIPAMAVRIFDAAELELTETALSDYTIFPNPVNDILNIVTEQESEASIEITDVSGRQVLTDEITFSAGVSAIDLKELSSGTYVVNIVLRSGNSCRKPFIKN